MVVVKMIGKAALVVLLGLAVYWEARVWEARNVSAWRVAAINTEADVELDTIPEARINALLAVEDPTFWTNRGIDLETPGAGLTTISQSLGKRIYFDRFKPGFAKVELMLMTRFGMHAKVTRHNILKAFLNVAYMGRDEAGPVIGFHEAARRWYGKELMMLSDTQFLGLVAMLLAPEKLDPVNHSAENAERVRRIKALLAHQCVPDGNGDVWLEGCRA
ncbi:transglycosylase domain-containing protein [Kordiimonas sp.]|uniref:transglycosylase domain-containing protein n=1 Tax=Kordiimonas sp. TaxID=1970157 RepID=UPI003A8FC168